MKRVLLIFAFLVLSCSNDEQGQATSKNYGVLTFTYQGVTKVYEGYNATDGTMVYDGEKPFFDWNFTKDTDYLTLMLNSGQPNFNKYDPNSYIFLMIKSKGVSKIYFSKAFKDIPLKKSKITITKIEGDFISGYFESDLLTGKFEKIKKF